MQLQKFNFKRSLRRTNWIIFQSLLIVISVLCAFWAENYREDKSKIKLRRTFVNALQKDFVEENEELSYVIKQIVYKRNSIDSLIKKFDQAFASGEILYRAELCERPLYLIGIEDESMVTLTTILSSQNLDLFTGDPTFTKILKYKKDRTFLRKQCERINQKITLQLTLFMNDTFDRSTDKNSARKPVKKFSFEAARKFKNLLISIRNDLPSLEWLNQIESDSLAISKALKDNIPA
jgi:hypothetical protein